MQSELVPQALTNFDLLEAKLRSLTLCCRWAPFTTRTLQRSLKQIPLHKRPLEATIVEFVTLGAWSSGPDDLQIQFWLHRFKNKFEDVERHFVFEDYGPRFSTLGATFIMSLF